MLDISKNIGAIMAYQERVQKNKMNDKQKFSAFKEQDLLDVDQELYKPEYSKFSKKLQKKQDAMLSLFNARKDEVLGRRATPGLDQLRF